MPFLHSFVRAWFHSANKSKSNRSRGSVLALESLESRALPSASPLTATLGAARTEQVQYREVEPQRVEIETGRGGHGMDDPAGHNAADDKGGVALARRADDPAGHDANDDRGGHGMDDPAGHDANDDHGGHGMDDPAGHK